MSVARTPTPTPTAAGNPYLALARFGRDPLGYLTDLAQSGPPGLVPFRFGTVPGILMTDPAVIEEVLEADDPALLGRGRFLATKRWFEAGVFYKSGSDYDRFVEQVGLPTWLDARTPALSRRHAERLAEGFRAGEPFEAFGAFQRLTAAVDWEALTGRKEDPDSIERLIRVTRRLPVLVQPFGETLWRLPSSGRRAAAELTATLDGILAELRDDSRGESRLAELVRQAASDPTLTETEIRGIVKTQFADPLHTWIFWTFYALSVHSEVEEAWHAEIDQVLGDEPATAEDVSRLPVTRRLLMESARLYPSVPGIFRETTAEVEVGGAVIPKGHTLVASQWVTHRDGRFWTDPLGFDLARWGDGGTKTVPYSYFPFSGGRLGCHGRDMAVAQAVVIMTTIGRHWKLRPESAREAVFTLGWNLEPKGGFRMLPEPR